MTVTVTVTGAGAGAGTPTSKGREGKRSAPCRAACIFTHSLKHSLSFSFRFLFSVFRLLHVHPFPRDFVQTHYKDLKTVNPTFPFLVRECEGIEAKIWARYGKKKKSDEEEEEETLYPLPHPSSGSSFWFTYPFPCDLFLSASRRIV